MNRRSSKKIKKLSEKLRSSGAEKGGDIPDSSGKIEKSEGR